MTALRDAIKRMIEDAPDDGSCTLMVEVIRRLLAQTEWQPIETAPKDGSEILIFDPMCTAPIFVARWSTEWSEDYWQSAACIEQYFGTNDPTHWMPLPEPPTD